MWLPHWPLQRFLAARPELEGRPLALWRSDPRRGRLVAVYSVEAAALGVRRAMPLTEAKALARRVGWGASPTKPPLPRVGLAEPRPTLHVAEHDSEADRRALAALAVRCHRYSPCVALDDVAEPAALQLEVGGVAQHFGGEGALAALVQAELAAHGWQTRLGLADAWGGAWAAAVGSEVGCVQRSADAPWLGPLPPQNTSEPRTDGASALRWTHPTGGIAIVPRGAGVAAYGALPLAALRLPAELLELLEELGLAQIGQLLRLPRPDLAARLGPLVGQRLDQLIGAATEVLLSQPLPVEDRAELPFAAPTDRQAVVTAALEQLLAQLAARLAGRRQGALALRCRLLGPGVAPTELEVRFYRPNSEARHWVELLGLALERRPLPGLVEKVEVQITAAGALEFRQQALFDEDAGNRDARLVGRLIDRLAGRLGREAVLAPRLVPEAQPELACRLEPLVGSERGAAPVKPPPRRKRTVGSVKRSADAPSVDLDPAVVRTADPMGFRPLWLWSPAEAVTVLGIAPEGAPARFRWRRREHVVGQAWGPERIETGWWRGRYVRRDYYRVETLLGERYWLFRRRRDGRWFLHGAFA